MERQEVERLVAKIKPGSKLKLTYKKDTGRATLYLIGMANAGIIKFEDEMEKAFAWAVGESGKWGNLNDRVVMVTTTKKFNSQWFIDRTHWPLEKLEIVA